ncbi:MAG: radical SAM protein [Paludibacteraceae bacterium]|nr:radical SAM protein [Paludibacteraceae bacterium]
MKRFATRFVNQLRCWGSYALSSVGLYCVRHMPVFVSVEPANFCQLSCPECPVGLRLNSAKRGVMTLEHFQRIVEQVAPYVHTIQLFWQGEPLLNGNLPQMVQIARNAGLYTIISTNAQSLDRSTAVALARAGLNRIIVSLDGWTQTTYEKYRRGGNVDKAKDAVRLLRQAKTETGARMTIELQCLLLKTNEAEWSTFRREYKRLGADRLTMKTAQLYNYEHGSPLMPSNPRFSRYKWDNRQSRYVPKHSLRNRCYRLWSGCVIDVNGNVLPCCYDKSQAHPFGNILAPNATLRGIWLGKQAESFRRAVITHRAEIPVCQNCE